MNHPAIFPKLFYNKAFTVSVNRPFGILPKLTERFALTYNDLSIFGRPGIGFESDFRLSFFEIFGTGEGALMVNVCGKTRFYFICLLLFFFLLPSPGFSGKTLDIPALKKAIAERTVASWGEQDPYYKKFSAAQVTIEKEIPIQVREFSLFAVKAVLKTPGDTPDEFLFLVVDETGTLQFPDIFDVKTGQSFFRDALNELRKIEKLPKDFGSLIFEGEGLHDVVAVSDPFCSYCRKGWAYFQGERRKIRSFKLAHFPLNPHSELVCMALLDAEIRKDHALEMADFAYTTLKQTADPEELMKQFMEAFPHLKRVWGKDSRAAVNYLSERYQGVLREEVFAAQRLGIKATPVFFIDGQMIEGYHEKQIRERMP